MVNDVAACAPRNAFLVDALLTAMAAEPERRALVLSERREHLKDLERRLRAAGRDDVGYYVGGMKQKSRSLGVFARLHPAARAATRRCRRRLQHSHHGFEIANSSLYHVEPHNFG